MTAPAEPGGAVVARLSTLLCGLSAATGFGLAAPLFALNLDDLGVREDLVGLIVTIVGVAGIVSTPLVPWLMSRLSVKVVLGGAALSTACAFIAFSQAGESVWAWAAIRFWFSCSLTVMFVTAEAWLLELAPTVRRGQWMGYYAASFAGGFGVGGAIAAWLGHTGPWPFVAGAIAALVALPLLLVPSPGATRPEGEAARPAALIARIRAAPFLFIPPIAMGAIETAAFNLFPIWARREGLEDAVGPLMITAAAAGNVLLQTPLGMLADRIGRERVLLLVSIVGIFGPLALMNAPGLMWVYATCFVWSGCVTGLYTMGLVGLGQTFDTRALAAANAAFAACYGIGQFVAPVAGGAAMRAMGPDGLLWVLSAVAVLPLATTLYSLSRRRTA
jgi:MFS family permease